MRTGGEWGERGVAIPGRAGEIGWEVKGGRVHLVLAQDRPQRVRRGRLSLYYNILIEWHLVLAHHRPQRVWRGRLLVEALLEAEEQQQLDDR